eukprot:11158382-Karenia_brevis.AAC.1
MKCAGGARGNVAAAAEHGLGTPQMHMKVARDTLGQVGDRGAAVACSAPKKCAGGAKEPVAAAAEQWLGTPQMH